MERARAAWELGLASIARREVDEARRILLASKHRRGLGTAYLWLARVELLDAKPGRAARAIEQASQIAEAGASADDRLLESAVRAELSVATGDPGCAARIGAFRKSAEEMGDPSAIAWSVALDGVRSIEDGIPEAIEQVRREYLALPSPWDRAPDVEWRGLALLAHVDPVARKRAQELLTALVHELAPSDRHAFLGRWDRVPYGERIGMDASLGRERVGRDLRCVSRILRAINTEPNVDVLLRLVLDSMVAAVGARSGVLVRVESDVLDAVLRRSSDGDDLPIEELALSTRIARQVARTGRSVCLGDAAKDTAWRQSESVIERALRSVLCVPLRQFGRSIGAIFLENRDRPEAFKVEDQEIAEVLGEQAAIAIGNAELRQRCDTDALTGLLTHAAFEHRAPEWIRLAAAGRGRCALLLVDLDRFKEINDTFGHDAGSHVLRELAGILRGAVRREDVTARVGRSVALVGRYGGDEFEILLPDCDRQGMALCAERILARVQEASYEFGGKTIRLSASLGGACFPEDATDARELFLRADEAMYAAKAAGRGRFLAYAKEVSAATSTPPPDLAARLGAELLNDLARATDGSHAEKDLLDRVVRAVVSATRAERGYLISFDEGDHLSIRAAFHLRENDARVDRFQPSLGTLVRLLGRDGAIRTRGATEGVQGTDSTRKLGIRSILAAPLDVGPRRVGALYLDSRAQGEGFNEKDEALVLDLSRRVASLLGEAGPGPRLPKDPAELRRVLEAGIKDVQARFRFGALLGESEAVLRLRSRLDHVVRFDFPVLVVGETGTGKEVVARAIHENGSRASSALVAVNCAALPRELLESELFGHVRGAFTGADRDRIGLFRAAEGGTLFLDEITEMPVDLQGKLLRVLQDGEYYALGDRTPRKANVRVVAATNRDPNALVKEGRFREDLFFRLNVLRLDIPPLRERHGDVVLLARHFLRKAQQETGASGVRLGEEAMRRLVAYSWPGNVRQLENALRYAVAFGGDEIGPEHLPPEVLAAVPQAPPAQPTGLRGARATGERKALIDALERRRGNVSAAARDLGMSRKQVRVLMKRHAIERKDLV